MKHFDFVALFYAVAVFIALFGMIFLMWTGATYLFIEETPKANAVDVIVIVIITLYATRDFFFKNYRPNKIRGKRKESQYDI